MAELDLYTEDLQFISSWFKDIHDEIVVIKAELNIYNALAQFNKSIEITFAAHDKLRQLYQRFERDEQILLEKDPCNYRPNKPFFVPDNLSYIFDDFEKWWNENPAFAIILKFLPLREIPNFFVALVTEDYLDIIKIPLDVIDGVGSGVWDIIDCATGNGYQDRRALESWIRFEYALRDDILDFITGTNARPYSDAADVFVEVFYLSPLEKINKIGLNVEEDSKAKY